MEFIREGTSFFRDPQVRNPQLIERCVESRGSPDRQIVFGSLEVFFRHGKANWTTV